MKYALLQKSLEIPDVEKLRRAFRVVRCLVDADAHTLARDAYGILVQNLSGADALSLQNALSGEGIPTELVAQAALPTLPPAKFVQRLDCLPEGLTVYDPIGRTFAVPWAQVTLVSAGYVRIPEWSSISRPAARRPFSRGNPDDQTMETIRREASAQRLLLHLTFGQSAAAYQAQADKFLFHYLGARQKPAEWENLALLVRDIHSFAPHAVLNRGAWFLAQEPVSLFEYPSRNAFHEEIIWLTWRMQALAR
jgi:hypothetical protein